MATAAADTLDNLPVVPFCRLLKVDLFLIDGPANLWPAAVKSILSRYLQIDPGAIDFVVGPLGKPALSSRLGTRLCFNQSRSGSLLLLGVSTAGEVGVDIEDSGRFTDAQPLLRRAFSAAEQGHLRRHGSSKSLPVLTQHWCRKEAIVKASGLGLSIPPESVNVNSPPGVTAGHLTLVTPSGDSFAVWCDIDLGAFSDQLVGSVALISRRRFQHVHLNPF